MKTFYIATTCIFLCAIMSIGWYFYAGYPSNPNITYKEKKVLSLVDGKKYDKRTYNSFKKGTLREVTATITLTDGHTKRDAFFIKNKHCITAITVNGKGRSFPKNRRNDCAKGFFKFKPKQPRFDVTMYVPQQRNIDFKVIPAPNTAHKYMSYAIVGCLLAWASIIMFSHIIYHQQYRGMFRGIETRHACFAILLFITALSLVLRLHYLPIISHDMASQLLRWYQHLQAYGYGAFDHKFYDYAPIYLYLLSLVDWIFPSMPPVHAIKLLSLMADYAGAGAIFMLVQKHSRRAMWLPIIAYAAYLFSPMVWINSAVWGQCDSIHTLAAIVALIYCLSGKYFATMMVWSIGLSFKIQAIFFAPIAVILWIKKKFHWSYWLLPPAIYVITMLPAALQGTDIFQLLNTHSSHIELSNALGRANLNPYMFISNAYYDIVMPIGIALTMALLACVATLALRFEREWDAIGILLLATLIFAISPYFLPKMLGRYFYSAAIISIPLAALYWRTIPAAILLNVAALGYPFSFIPNPLELNGYERRVMAVILNGLALIQLVGIYLYRLRGQARKASRPLS